MALYAIGDTHLSLGADKPMDVFGGGWAGYVEQAAGRAFPPCQTEDTVVLCGDLSWAMSLEEAPGGLCVSARAAGEEAAAEGQSRLLVVHGGENAPLLPGKRL